MVWNGANDPQEYVVDEVKAADMEPIDAADLAFGEADGAASINADAVAKRLNDLLVIVQQLEERAARHYANRWDHVVED